MVVAFHHLTVYYCTILSIPFTYSDTPTLYTVATVLWQHELNALVHSFLPGTESTVDA
jgi:hypothetical protein